MNIGESKLTGNYMSERYLHDIFVHETNSDASLSDTERNKKIEEYETRAREMAIERKAVMKDLIGMANEPNGLIHLRRNAFSATEDTDVSKKKFFLFVDTVLVSMIGKTKWKKNFLNRKFSRYSTIADEAIALLIVENIAPDLMSILNTENSRSQLMISRKTSKAKFTKSRKDSMKGTQHGWSEEGIKRYNMLFMETKKERERESAKDLEGDLMKYFKIHEDSGDEMDEEEDNEECDVNPEYVDPVDMFEIDSDTIPMPSLNSGNIHGV